VSLFVVYLTSAFTRLSSFCAVLSWVISPGMGCLISFCLFYTIRTFVLTAKAPEKAVKQFMPWYQGGTIGLLVTFLTLLGPEAYRGSPLAAVGAGLGVTLIVAGIAMGHSGLLTSMLQSTRAGASALASGASSPHSPEEGLGLVGDKPDSLVADVGDAAGGAASPTSSPVDAETAFLPLMVLTACVVSFAHGSNDISNAVGPMLAILLSDPGASAAIGYSEGDGVPVAVLALGGVGIIVGLVVWGHKVMATVGENITKLTFSRGYAAQVGTALTVLVASVSGISVSTTHCLIGAITGVALADGGGIKSINKETLKKIALSWVITIPAAAVAAIVCHTLLTALLL
jgi:phosphate/sulfate permease